MVKSNLIKFLLIRNLSTSYRFDWSASFGLEGFHCTSPTKPLHCIVLPHQTTNLYTTPPPPHPTPQPVYYYPQTVYYYPPPKLYTTTPHQTPNLYTTTPNLYTTTPNLYTTTPNLYTTTPNLYTTTPNLYTTTPTKPVYYYNRTSRRGIPRSHTKWPFAPPRSTPVRT